MRKPVPKRIFIITVQPYLTLHTTIGIYEYASIHLDPHINMFEHIHKHKSDYVQEHTHTSRIYNNVDIRYVCRYLEAFLIHVANIRLW